MCFMDQCLIVWFLDINVYNILWSSVRSKIFLWNVVSDGVAAIMFKFTVSIEPNSRWASKF